MSVAANELYFRPKEVFFTAPPGSTRDELWSGAARMRAAQLGYCVRLNPHASPLGTEKWARLLANADAIITTWKAPCLDEAVLKYNRCLKIVGHAAGSVAQVFSPELTRRGIPIVSANAEMAQSVAQWSLMMTLTALDRFPEYAQIGVSLPLNWSGGCEKISSHKAVIGIWGFGEVARQFIGLLNSLAPRDILVSSDCLSFQEASELGVTKVDFDDLFRRSDVLHLLEGLTRETQGNVGQTQLAALKDGAVLINAGRAPLVDEDALLAHLREERTRAILDVHYQEPLPEDSVWRGLSNVILTPHCAGWGRYDLYVKLVLDEFDRFFRNQPLQHEIAPQRASTMTDDRLLVV